MLYVLLGVSVVLAVAKSSLMNNFGKKHIDGNIAIILFNLFTYIMAAIIQLCFGASFSKEMTTILPATGYAVFLLLMQASSLKAMSCGPMALSSLFVMYGLIIPSLAGPIFWHEEFSVMQAIGIVLMLFAIYISSTTKQSKEENADGISKRWYMYAILSLIFSGLVGLFEKVHQTGPSADEVGAFLLTAFTILIVLNGIIVLFSHIKNHNVNVNKGALICAVLTGIISAFYNRINLILAGGLDSMVYYPISSGGAILLTVIVAGLFFREKFTKRSITGIVIGGISIILLGL